MANQHTQALETRAAELAAEYFPIQARADNLYLIMNNPICGKPGRGYKAARKAKSEYKQVEPQLDAINAKINDFIQGSSKDSYDKRERRRQYWKAACREWGA